MSTEMKHHRGSARMFENPVLEWLSHVHPAMPAVVYTPVIVASLWAALAHYGMGTGTALWHFGVGFLGWTLFEYWFHRLFFHLPVVGPKTERVYFYVHGVHHDWPWDTSRLVIPPSISVLIALVIYGVFRLALGVEMMYAMFAGFLFGYVRYDTVHWYTHAGKPRTWWGKYLRRQHMTHHFKAPGTRFGVSCPWWDYVFGTTGNRGD